MTALSDTSSTNSSTTRISTDLEKLWRDEFFAKQGRTPADRAAELDLAQPQLELRAMTNVVRFAGGVYDRTIVEFYENVIIELQREVERYRALWAATRAHEDAQFTGAYIQKQPVRLTPHMAGKLKRPPAMPLRIPEE
jgi:hypothetical protein